MKLSFIKNGTDHALLNLLKSLFRQCCFGVLAVSATILATPTLAADSSNMPNAKTSYQRDRAMCNSGQSNQDRATCLKEAGAAYGEARRGQLNDDQTRYNQNALERCKALPAEDMQACQRRIMGEGMAEGSAQEGGIYRRIETPVATPSNRPY